jgi:hypothetical protein
MCQYRCKSSSVKLVKAKIVKRDNGKINEKTENEFFEFFENLIVVRFFVKKIRSKIFMSNFSFGGYRKVFGCRVAVK